MLRHASIRTTGDVYMQAIERSVLETMNSRTLQILAGWKHPTAIGSKPPVEVVRISKAKRLALGGSQQLNQVEPSLEGDEL